MIFVPGIGWFYRQTGEESSILVGPFQSFNQAAEDAWYNPAIQSGFVDHIIRRVKCK